MLDNVIFETVKKNKTLRFLSISIIFLGFFIEIVGLLFTNDAINFTISMWIGIVLSIACAVHMAIALDYAMDLGEDGAPQYLVKHNLIRYGVIVVVFSMILMTDYLNPLYTFLGIMTLKVGAYLVPFTDKLLSYKKKKQ
ncbi:MAG: hypothetical protein R3Y54_11570 [Eubacteriales bacterium]